MPCRQDESFNITDFALFHHFVTSTSNAMSNEPEISFPWKTTIPGIAPQHPYLLHEILAVAAIHLQYLHPDDPTDYQLLAREHQARALSGFRDALTSQSADQEAPALLACSALIVHYYFTDAKDPASMLFNEDPPGPPHWMFPIRGCGVLIGLLADTLHSGPMGAMLDSYKSPWHGDITPFPFVACPSDDQIQLLDKRLQSLTAPEEQATYAPAMEELRRCFTISEEGGPISHKNAAFAFPSNVSSDFLEAMAVQKRPYALVLMGFWCVLLNRIDRKWWFRNDSIVKDMLQLIRSLLPPNYAELIDWPIKELGLNSTDE
jgi:hypothetical protein